MERLLIVDDDRELCELVAELLEGEGFRVEFSNRSDEGLARALSGAYSLVVLDVMMPGMNGFEVLRRLRAEGSGVHVLMLTARGDDVDRIVGLEIGADDYLPKPFEPRELVLRCAGLLRRAAPPQQPHREIKMGDAVFDPDRGELRQGDEVIRITERERDMLRVLTASVGETVPRQALSGQGDNVSERTVDVQVNRLRRKIERDPANPLLVQTVRGIGYRLVSAP